MSRYYNSTIKIKFGLCKECRDGKEKPIKGDDLCVYHYDIRMKVRSMKKSADRNNRRLEPELLPYKNIPQDEINKWYEDRMKESEPICWNCEARADWITRPSNERLFRSAIAHILPKRQTMFPSVATHPLNFMVLFAGYSGVCSCHDQWDANWENAGKMKVFPIALERVKLIYPFIAKHELRNLPEIFRQEIEPV